MSRRVENKKYQKDYYRRHRKLLLQKRRRRYRENIEYRESVKSRARLHRKITCLPNLARAVSLSEVRHAGKSEIAYSRNEMLQRLPRAKYTLFRWRKGGVIPAAVYSHPDGHDLYAHSQVELISCILNQIDSGTVEITFRVLRKILRQLWRKEFSQEEVLKCLANERK